MYRVTSVPMTSAVRDRWQLRRLTWTTAATMPMRDLQALTGTAQDIPLPPINASLAAPRGFVVDIGPDPRAAHLVAASVPGASHIFTAGSATGAIEHVTVSSHLIDAADVARLRHYSYVLVDESSCAGPYHLATMVVALCLAGVPVATTWLPLIVRSMIDRSLLELTDDIDEQAMRCPNQREALSLAIRRCAHRTHRGVVGPGETHPDVLVVIDTADEEASARLLAEVEQQTWPNIQVRVNATAIPTDAAFTTELDAEVSYGPHHIEDLVFAHHYSASGTVAGAQRFQLASRRRVVLERPGVVGEAMGQPAMPGTTMWQSDEPRDADHRPPYIVHGCNAVALGTETDPGTRERPDLLVAHHDDLPQLSWLSRSSDAVGTSYFAQANVPGRS